MSKALWAGWALDMNVDRFGQGMRFWHNASLKEAGAQHSQSPVACLGEVDSGDRDDFKFRYFDLLFDIDRFFGR
jgi:hypothetical protein